MNKYQIQFPKKLKSYRSRRKIGIPTESSGLQDNEGFSTVELLVTLAIFVIITTIVLVNFPTLSNKIALENLVTEVALTVRQAQVFGVSSREFGVGSGIFPGHGVHFDSAQNTTFFLFADVDDDKLFDESTELLETFSMRRLNFISALCGFATPTSPCTPLTKLDITFKRPNPEPILRGTTATVDDYSYVAIQVSSPSGNNRRIIVWSNGQIAIQ